MQDDLQKAYSAYQQALYLLPNPKVNLDCITYVYYALPRCLLRRTPNSGTESEFFMIVMDPSIMPKKRFLQFYGWMAVGHLCFFRSERHFD